MASPTNKMPLIVPATFRGPPRGSLGPQETTKQYYTRKNTQQSWGEKVVSVGHPVGVGVGAPGTGVARKVAPTPPLGFPTGTHTMYFCLTSCRSYTMCDRAWPKEVFFRLELLRYTTVR